MNKNFIVFIKKVFTIRIIIMIMIIICLGILYDLRQELRTQGSECLSNPVKAALEYIETNVDEGTLSCNCIGSNNGITKNIFLTKEKIQITSFGGTNFFS